MRDVGGVLGRDHHGVDAVHLAVHVPERDLRLGIRTQPRQAAVLAQLCLALHEAVRVVDGRGHQVGGFVAGVAEHQALVAGALFEVQALAFVHTLGDVLALLVIADHDGAAAVVDAVVGVVIADALDGVACDLDVVDIGAGGDFTGEHDQTGVAQRLGGDPAVFVLRENCVENRVRDLVGDFVGVTFGD